MAERSLASYENRKNDHMGERAFITVQSLKKLGQTPRLCPSGE